MRLALFIVAVVTTTTTATAGTLLDIVPKDSTNRSVCIYIMDSTTGLPETAVEHDTSGIDLWYRREGAVKTSITEAALAALTTAHTDGGIEAVSNGEYRLDLPDAAYATGAEYVDVGGTVTGMVVRGGRVRLVDFDIETATQPVNLTQMGGVAQSATDLKDFADAGYNPATNKVTGVVLVDTTTTNTDMVSEPLDAAGVRTAVGLAAANLDTQLAALPTAAENADAVWDEVIVGAHDIANSAGALLDSPADWATAVGFSTHSQGDVWAVDATSQQTQGTFGQVLGDSALDTDSVWALANTNLDATVSSRSTVTTAQVNTEADTALADYDPPTNAEMVARTILAASYFDPSLDTVATVTTLTGHTAQTGDTYALAVGATGFAAIDGNVDSVLVDTGTSLPGQIAGLNDLSTAEVNTQADLALSDFFTSPATLVDLIWDEDVDTSHQTAGTAGKKLDDAGAAADPWSTALPGAYGAGTAGYILGTNLDATVSSRGTSTVTTAEVNAQADLALSDYDGPTNAEMIARTILAASYFDPAADTVAIVTTLTGHTAQTGDSFALANGTSGFVAIDGNVDSVLVDTGTSLPAQIAGLNDLSTSEVNLQVDLALADFWTSAATLVDLVWDEDVDTSHQTAGTAGKKLDDFGAAADPWTTAVPGAYGAGTAGFILGTNLDATVSSRGTSTVTTAQVNTEVDTAIAEFRLDELLAADSDIDGAAPPAVGSVWHEAMSKTVGSFTFDQTTDALEAVADGGVGPTAEQVADAVWDEDIVAAHNTADTGGAILPAVLADTDDIGVAGAGLTALATQASVDTVDGIVDDILEDTGTTLPATTFAANLTQIEGHALAGTGTQIADGFEYWFDVATPAKTMNDAGVAGAGLTAANVWDYNIAAITGTGYAGNFLNNVDTDTVTVTMVGPVVESGELEMVRGDDYDDALSNALEWSSTAWPDLTTATIAFSLRERDDGTVIMDGLVGEVTVAGGGSQTVKVELTAANWALSDGAKEAHEYDVVATISGKSLTLVRDDATVTDDVTK